MIASSGFVARGEAGQMDINEVPMIYKDEYGNVLTEVEQWMVTATRSPGMVELGYTHVEYGETVQRLPTTIRLIRELDCSQKVIWRKPDSGTWTAYHGAWTYNHAKRQLNVWFHCSGITALCDQVMKFHVISESPLTFRADIAGAKRGVHTVDLNLLTTVNGSTWFLQPGTARWLKEYERMYENAVLLTFTREYQDTPPPPPPAITRYSTVSPKVPGDVTSKVPDEVKMCAL